jgi:ABC-type phosphate transport system substrate-binding protein
MTMRNLNRTMILAVALVAALGITTRPVSAQGFKLIAHSSFKPDELDKPTAEKVFLKKLTNIGGQPVSAVDQPVASAARAAFSKAILGRPAQAMNEFWQQQIFSGADVPPPAKPTDDAVVEFVAKTPGAIGYVSSAAATPGVKVIAVK